MKNKRVLYINVTYKNASTGQIIDEITSQAASNQFDYKVLFQFGDNQDKNSYQFESKLDKFIRRIIRKLTGNVTWYTFIETKKIIAQIRNYGPDIIHLHTIHHQCTNYSMLYKFLIKYGKPIIVTLHDCWAYTGGCYYYTEFGCSQYITGCKKCTMRREDLDCPLKKTRSNFAKKRNFYSKCNNLIVVGVSDWICKEAKKSILANKSIFCIHNGVNINIFKRYQDNQDVLKKSLELHNRRKYLVLGVANVWDSRKNPELFYKLADLLGEDYQVVLVGDTEKKLKNKDNIMLYGKTSNSKELSYIYNVADVFVNMSIEETFGLVTAEAAVCGTSVVAFDSTANSEIANIANGKLVQVGDIDGVASAVKQICQKKETVQNIEQVRKELSSQKMTKDYWKLYNDIINNTYK